MGEGGIDDKGIVIEVKGAWNLGGMKMLSCMRADIGVSVCMLVVMVLVWMWMVLTVWVVVGVLAVLLAKVLATMVGMLVEVGCVGVVFESCGQGFFGSGAGGFWGRVMVWMEDDFVVLK